MTTATAEPQHLTALHRANRIRLERAATKRWLREPGDREESMRRCAQLLDDPPAHLATMRVVDLLAACHRVGTRLAEQRARRHHITPVRVVGQLTDRQRRALAGDLRGEREQLQILGGWR